ncbi:MAG: hypothetical protein AAF208_03875 [Cyanobacteria bacterium P01_A01_bin.45]
MEESTLPPFLTTKLSVLILKLPAFPLPSVEAVIVLGIKLSKFKPIKSIDLASIFNSPPSPDDKIVDAKTPPSRIVNCSVKTEIFPPLPVAKAADEIS